MPEPTPQDLRRWRAAINNGFGAIKHGAVMDGLDATGVTKDEALAWALDAIEAGEQALDALDAMAARQQRLEEELDAAQLRSIEASNPGIDMERVRAYRAARAVSEEAPAPTQPEETT